MVGYVSLLANAVLVYLECMLASAIIVYFGFLGFLGVSYVLVRFGGMPEMLARAKSLFGIPTLAHLVLIAVYPMRLLMPDGWSAAYTFGVLLVFYWVFGDPKYPFANRKITSFFKLK